MTSWLPPRKSGERRAVWRAPPDSTESLASCSVDPASAASVQGRKELSAARWGRAPRLAAIACPRKRRCSTETANSRGALPGTPTFPRLGRAGISVDGVESRYDDPAADDSPAGRRRIIRIVAGAAGPDKSSRFALELGDAEVQHEQ